MSPSSMREVVELAQRRGRIVADELDEQDRVRLADQRALDHRPERRIAARKVDHRPIDELDRRRPELRRGAARNPSPGAATEKLTTPSARCTRQRRELQRQRARPRERAFAADEQVREIDAAVTRVRTLALRVEDVERCSRRRGASPSAPRARSRRARARRSNAARRGAPARGPTLRPSRARAEPRLRAVGKPRIERSDVVHHVAVRERARAAGVVARHAAQCALRRRADVDRKPQAVLAQPSVQCVEHDAGLDGDCLLLGVECDDAVEMLAVVDRPAPRRPSARTASFRRRAEASACARLAHICIAARTSSSSSGTSTPSGCTW